MNIQLNHNGQQMGTFTREQVEGMIRSGAITYETLGRTETVWRPVRDLILVGTQPPRCETSVSASPIHLNHNGHALGSFSREQVEAMLRSGAISYQTLAWTNNQTDCAQPLHELIGTPVPPPVQSPIQAQAVGDRSGGPSKRLIASPPEKPSPDSAEQVPLSFLNQCIVAVLSWPVFLFIKIILMVLLKGNYGMWFLAALACFYPWWLWHCFVREWLRDSQQAAALRACRQDAYNRGVANVSSVMPTYAAPEPELGFVNLCIVAALSWPPCLILGVGFLAAAASAADDSNAGQGVIALVLLALFYPWWRYHCALKSWRQGSARDRLNKQ